MRYLLRTLVLSICLLTRMASHASDVMLYRQLPEFDLSDIYKVEVRNAEGEFQEVFVYQMDTDNNNHVTQMDHFTQFAFEPDSGAAVLRVTLKDGAPLTADAVELVNQTHDDVTSSIEDGAFMLTVGGAKKHLFVRRPSDKAHPLMIFADPMQLSKIPEGAKVHTFSHEDSPHVINAAYDRFTVPNDVDVVYIEDGALVKGTIHTANGRTTPLKLIGRGVVLGNGKVMHGAANIPYNAVVITHGGNHVIEGIMVIKSRHFSVNVGDYGVVDNVKMYGYDANNDGIVAGDHATIRHTFFKVNDDHIKVYNDGLHVHDCTFHAQTNGAIFQYCWGGQGPTRDALIENCEVLAVEFAWCGDPALSQGGVARSFINLRNNNKANTWFSGQVYRNIRIQGQLKRFISINGKYGVEPLSFHASLENIEVDKAPEQQSLLYSEGETNVIELRLRDVMFARRCVDESHFKTTGNAHVAITCGATEQTPPVVNITFPSDSAVYLAGATVPVRADITDDRGVFKAGLYVRDILCADAYTPPYEFQYKFNLPGTYTLKITGEDAAGNIGVDSLAVIVKRITALPQGWLSRSIGDPALKGGVAFASDTFEVFGTGTDMSHTADEFQYVYTPLTGDGVMTARVVSQEASNVRAKAGLMIRETTEAGSRHAAIVTTPGHGVSFQQRTETDGTSEHTSPENGVTAPVWLKLERSEDRFKGFYSMDSTEWTLVHEANITMAETMAGLAVTSHDENMLSTARFTDVMVTDAITSVPEKTRPLHFALFENYPNPFNPSTTIRYQLSSVCKVRMEVFDVTGRIVAVLVDEEQAAGNYQATLNAASLASGIYYYRLSAGGDGKPWVKTGKMALVK